VYEPLDQLEVTVGKIGKQLRDRPRRLPPRLERFGVPLVTIGQESSEWEIERRCEPTDHIERWMPGAGFDPGEVARRDVRAFGEHLLGHLVIDAKARNPATELPVPTLFHSLARTMSVVSKNDYALLVIIAADQA
jgi:hypothetical protein